MEAAQGEQPLGLPPAGSAPRPAEARGEWEVGEARAAVVRFAVHRGPLGVPPLARSDVGSLAPGAALQQLLDAGLSPRLSMAKSPRSPTDSPSRTAGGGGFFTTLDSWIGAAQTVVRGADGVETLKLKLLSLAKLSNWEATFASLAGGSGEELTLEGFARFVRLRLGTPPQKVGDDELARLFRLIDRQGFSTVDASSLKDHLQMSEARARARVLFFQTDWEDVFCFEEGLHGGSLLGGLDLPIFFVALRREQARVKHPIDYTPLTDHDIELIFKGAQLASGSKPSGRVTASQLETFLKQVNAGAETAGSSTDDAVGYALRRVSDAMRVASYGMDWNELFDRYDTDGSGTLDFNEFEHAVRFFLRISEQDISFERLEQLFGLINSESTGELGVAQFREFLWLDELKRHIRLVGTKRRPWAQIFSDICTSGEIDLLTFALVLTMLHGCATEKLSREEVERLFRQIQSDAIAGDDDSGRDAGGRSSTINAEQLERFVGTRRPVPESAIDLTGLHQLHVRGIGVHGWDGTSTGKGTYEDAQKLKTLFMPFGRVTEVAKVRHRIADHQNTSWALITMETAEGVERALLAAEGDGVFAGSHRLVINKFSQKQAAVSKGAMGIAQVQAHEKAKLEHGHAKDLHQIHVREIGAEGWDGSDEGVGKYENETALRHIFENFGRVIEVAKIRHRIQDGRNTSWALVTMGSAAAVDRALLAAERSGVFAGSQRLVLTKFSQKQASISKGAMAEAQQAAITEKLLSRQQRETAKYLEAREAINRRTAIDSAMEAIRAARAERECHRSAESAPVAEDREQRLQRLGRRSPRGRRSSLDPQ